jgi:uncharacterized SAM-dependent methyltransferase
MLDTDARTAFLDSFRRDVVDGLAATPKSLPARWLYDDHGSALFEAITQLPEYYPTRTETRILADAAGGWRAGPIWTDAARRFAVFGLIAAG